MLFPNTFRFGYTTNAVCLGDSVRAIFRVAHLCVRIRRGAASFVPR